MLVFAAIFTMPGCKKREGSPKLSLGSSALEHGEDDMKDTDNSVLGVQLTPYEFDEASLPVMHFTYSTSEMAVASTSALLGLSREDSMNMLIRKNNTFEEDHAVVDLIPDILIANRGNHLYAPFAADGLVFIVNKDNPVESLTIAQIKKIYKGEIRNWKEVGGNDEEIIPFDEGVADTSRKVMGTLILGGTSSVSPYIRIPIEDNQHYDARATYDNSKNAIGYVEYTSLTGSHWENETKMLKVEGVEPTRETIASGEYPLQFLLDVMVGSNTDLSSPEGILFQWMAGEDGRSIAEMAGYIVPEGKPKMTKRYSVTMDNSAFRAVEKEEEKITRLSDDPITDFIPSEDYGMVTPFLGVENQFNNNEGQSLYGFMDKSGRIICDPVFDSAMMLDDGSIFVMQYVRDSDLPDGQAKMGLISKDGASYTGLKYDLRFQRDGMTYFASAATSGITLYKYDPSKGAVDSGTALKIGDITTMYAFETIVDERFIVCRDYCDDKNWIYDGVTGKDICPEMSARCSDWQLLGDFVYGQDKEAENGGSRIFSLDGKALSDDFYLSYKTQMPDYYLLGRAGFTDDKKDTLTETCVAWDLLDRDGKILATIPNEDGSILDVHHIGEHLVAVKEAGMDLYDLSGKLIKTVPLEDAASYNLPGDPLGEDNSEIEMGKRLPVFFVSNTDTKLVNLETEKTISMEGEYECIRAGENILLKSFTDNTWKLLNASDFSILAEGEGEVEIKKDACAQKLYLVHGNSVGRYAFEETVTDAVTGSPVITVKSDNYDGFVHVTHIVSGNVIYQTKQFSCDGLYLTNRTTAIDRSGEILLRYNTVALAGK